MLYHSRRKNGYRLGFGIAGLGDPMTKRFEVQDVTNQPRTLLL
jgi:hypothetical protein